jgi:hypothetical protein
MDNVLYKKNVFKTLSIKPAKLGLKFVASNTVRTNVFHAGLGMFTEGGELVVGLAPYLLGASKLTEPMKVNAFEEMGDLGYYLAVLCKSLKIKMPSSSKKVKLKGMTRSEAVLALFACTSEVGDLCKKVLYGPKTKMVEREKLIKSMNADGTIGESSKQMEQVSVPDYAATVDLYNERHAKIKEIIESRFIPLYWALAYDLFECPPANLFVGNIAKLSKRYGEGMFQLSEAEQRDTEEEMDAMTGAN